MPLNDNDYPLLSRALGQEDGFDPSDPTIQKDMRALLSVLIDLLSTDYELNVIDSRNNTLFFVRVPKSSSDRSFQNSKESLGVAINNHFLEESDDHPFSCDEMADEGFCNDIYNCWDDECHKDCGSEVVEAVTCYFEHNTDCHDKEYEEQCTDSLSLMKSLI